MTGRRSMTLRRSQSGTPDLRVAAATEGPGRATRMFRMAVAALAGAVLVGCATSPTATSRPAAISHVVLVKLKATSDAPELLADSDAKLSAIPSVVSYAAGPPLDSGRTNVESGYDVGLYIGFADDAGYRAYVDHPNHTQLVEKWRPRWEWIRIYDVYDPTP